MPMNPEKLNPASAICDVSYMPINTMNITTSGAANSAVTRLTASIPSLCSLIVEMTLRKRPLSV